MSGENQTTKRIAEAVHPIMPPELFDTATTESYKPPVDLSHISQAEPEPSPAQKLQHVCLLCRRVFRTGRGLSMHITFMHSGREWVRCHHKSDKPVTEKKPRMVKAPKVKDEMVPF